MKTFHEYQAGTEYTKAYKDWSQDEERAYAIIGLTNEAGEVAGELKKLMRDDDGVLTADRRAKMLDELGDCLWYLARASEALDADLEELAEINTHKVTRRHRDGTVSGSGSR